MTSKAEMSAVESEDISDGKKKQTKGARSRPKTSELVLPETVTVKQLADLLGVGAVDVIKQLMRSGVMAAMNQAIGFDLAELITPAFGYQAKLSEEKDRREQIVSKEENISSLVTRPPVVTVMGHVDHGKTTLLDAIRDTKVVDGEAGGITQHIGAYQVEYKGQKLTFLDTPGHEAFTAIRARGARVTDIAVLVVAADDGVMPQTVEAIDHARAANVPVIVAINKMDRPEADADRVKRELAERDIVLEEWGGDVIAVPVSATEGTGLEDLLENLLVVADLAELKANPNRTAKGVVIEARLDKNKGAMATVLVQTGTLKIGDVVVAGGAFGRIKAMSDEKSQRVKVAEHAMPVEVMGFGSLPIAGDIFECLSDEKSARASIAARGKEMETDSASVLSMDEIHAKISTGEVKELNLIVKGDVQGSIDAVKTSLESLNVGEVTVRLIHWASGTITESDILLASASKAIILGFNVPVAQGSDRLAVRENVEIRHYKIIYHLIEDVEKALKGLLEPTRREVVQGRAEVRAVFTAGKRGNIAGCMVVDGRFARGLAVRLLRGGETLHEGQVSSLRRFKQDVNEVSSGYECGVGVQGYSDFQVGDVLETYRTEKTKN